MKTTFSLSFLIFTSVILCGAISSTSVCIEDASDFQKQKHLLPPVFQSLPVLLTTDNILVTAGLRIAAVGNKLKLEGSVWRPGQIYSDENYLKKLCYEQDKIQVTFENKKTFEVDTANNSVRILGFQFNQSSDVQFAKILNKIDKGRESQRIRSSTGAQ